jgi:hypothetical protein
MISAMKHLARAINIRERERGVQRASRAYLFRLLINELAMPVAMPTPLNAMMKQTRMGMLLLSRAYEREDH